jgi:hypothetical protein
MSEVTAAGRGGLLDLWQEDRESVLSLVLYLEILEFC